MTQIFEIASQGYNGTTADPEMVEAMVTKAAGVKTQGGKSPVPEELTIWLKEKTNKREHIQITVAGMKFIIMKSIRENRPTYARPE